LSKAFAAKLVPVSSGSASLSSAALLITKLKGDSKFLISRILPLLWLATTSEEPGASTITV
jgi:hypothetical protein